MAQLRCKLPDRLLDVCPVQPHKLADQAAILGLAKSVKLWFFSVFVFLPLGLGGAFQVTQAQLL